MELESRRPKATRFTIEEVALEEEERDSQEEVPIQTPRVHVDDELVQGMEPPPTTLEPIFIKPKRSPRPGDSALGVSVLAIKGWVEIVSGSPMILRLDSCADITLIADWYYNSLANPPPLRTGRQMSLAQLTDQGTVIKGFVKLKVFMQTTSGELIRTEAEAYVVKGMTVPLLLGEDYQLNFELGVVRNVETGSKILFRNTPYEVEATGVGAFPGQAEAHALASRLTVHAEGVLKARAHRRAKERRKRRRLRHGSEGRTVRAAEDYLIKAQETKVVRVEGDFSEDREWLVQAKLIATSEDGFLSVPNTLLSARKPAVPISNLSHRPRYIRKGEIVGELTDPSEFFESPRTEDGLHALQERTALVSAIIEANLAKDQSSKEESDRPKTERAGKRRDQSPKKETSANGTQIRTNFGSGVPPMEENILRGVHVVDELGRVRDLGPQETTADESEEYGPKTAAMPDSTVYPSSEMEQLLDIGSLPDHLKEKAWAMLKKRVNAFGFDGRLGHHPAKVHVWTKAGQEPIAVPMYGSSPEKRRVINSQLDKWFEQGVIEPSISPWSAPVVIAYRNGKPRFCVDYRKLNAVTIADEFLIPRQSEILSSLSGAQVLSSLDALSGFTQLEIAEEDVEKTAFRTHRGLAQFKRMPFGLRNGPSIFQRVMQGILSPYLWLFALVYIDDIVVYSKSYEEHIDHLDQVLGAIENAGITLSPAKCHLFYSSILLLGHKVSRLGLSMHLEKVKAILELERPKKLAQLQAFLGMAVYFSLFIPYYADRCMPLFQLLRKGARWEWGTEQEYAFQSLKDALRSAPVLGHPIEGLPYRLYSDASDEAAGVALQQIQRIRVRDLKGTRAYEKLRKAFDAGLPPPKLTTHLSEKIQDDKFTDTWAEDFDESEVHVERVIGYWSRSFKGAETRYSTTEREALAAKEGLVRFQPFIKGEKIILVTDHSALQWARMYENSNRRLAAWGSVFSAYAPGLEIVHRAGRKHSNVDPLSRLPRTALDHQSPTEIGEKPIEMTGDLSAVQEAWLERSLVERATFVAYSLEDCIEGFPKAFAVTRSYTKRQTREAEDERPSNDEARGGSSESHSESENHFASKPLPKMDKPHPPKEYPPPDWDSRKPDNEPVRQERVVLGSVDELSALDAMSEYWGATHRPPNLHIAIDEEYRKAFVADYNKDPSLRYIWNSKRVSEGNWTPGQRFFKNDEGLLFFRDADFKPRLCVPAARTWEIMTEAHEAPMESAHVSPDRLWAKLRSKFYWKRMKNDIDLFGLSCDVCQKIKPSNFSRYGFLIPNAIPTKPYESISLDLIVNLPWSGEYNTILVVVDRLTKHASFIPTTSGLTAEGFANLFVLHIVSRFGLPDDVIADRDPRWTSDFWRAVSVAIKTKMSLSSSHHPQHDGQTEIVNRHLETMLRAYIAKDKSDWADWLAILEFAYNSSIHSSTGVTPFLLLYGFEPKAPLDYLVPRDVAAKASYGMSKQSSQYLEAIQMHWENARLSLARAQEEQAQYYNHGRREVPEIEVGSKVLVNPHSLEWVESKGEGSKLVQR
jgi:hypothetical protein